jgi:hypothetical protein
MSDMPQIPPSRLSPEFIPYFEQSLQKDVMIRAELVKNYLGIYTAAEDGKSITARDYTSAEQKFNTAVMLQEKQLAKLVKTQAAAMGFAITSADGKVIASTIDPKTGLPAQGAPAEFIADPVKLQAYKEARLTADYHSEVDRRFYTWLIQQPGHEKLLKQPEPLNRIFQRDHVENAPKKDADLQPGANAVALLEKNKGLAVATAHTSGYDMEWVAGNVKAFKQAGMDTAYIELNPVMFKTLNKYSAAELRQLAKDGRIGDFVLPDPKQIEAQYNAPLQGDPVRSMVGMMAAFKEEGIRMVNLKRDNIEFEASRLGMSHRNASSNFVWTDIIKKDRADLEQQGKGGGKYLIVAGATHLIDDSIGRKKGLIDDALGVPVVAFDARPLNDPAGAIRGHGRNSADYFLPGGEGHIDLRKLAAANDAKDVAEVLSPFGFLPGIREAVEGLKIAGGEMHYDAIGKYDAKQPVSPPSVPRNAAVVNKDGKTF